MSCSNCGQDFGEEVTKVNTIVSIQNNKTLKLEEQETQPLTLTSSPDAATTDTDKDETSISVPLWEALSTVFERPPLSSENSNLHKSLFQTSTECGDRGRKEAFDFCPPCAQVLTLLYNSFKDFTRICKLECEVARRLQQIEGLRAQKSEIILNQPTPRKRGRPKGTGAKNKKAKTVAVSAVKEDVEEGFKVEIKKEIMDFGGDDEFSDGEFDHYYGGRVSSASSSPPDSPVSLDLNEIAPRSPRPVRRTSARNKNWAKLYEDLEDDDDEVPGPIEPLKHVEVKFEEDKTTSKEPEETATSVQADSSATEAETEAAIPEALDDDDDEEYRPDEDLEEMYASAAEEKRPRRHRGSPKRHTSMFKSINRSMKHLMRRSSSGNFECLECGKCFGHRKSLERHCRTHTDDDGAVQCPTCNKLFSRDDHLKRHRRQVHGEDIPFKSWKKDGEVIQHQPKQYECPLCKETYSRKAIQEHVETHKIEKPWTCKSCPLQFKTLTQMNQHWTGVHYQRPRVSCEVCSREFRSGYHLRRHQQSIHHVRIDKLGLGDSSSESSSEEEPEASRAEEQPEQKVLDEQGNLILSIKPDSKKVLKQKPFKCQECGKKFKRKEKLTEHLITHGIGERHKCEVCGREFNHIRSKNRHMFLHSEENPYRCTEAACEKGFSRKDHLVRHMQKFHGIVTLEGELGGPPSSSKLDKKPREPLAREIQCQHCDKVIKRERMRLHMVIHTGEKRHMCDLCGQKFGLRTTLLTHIQCVHQGVRRYACSYCGQAFKRSNHLKDHEKLHTDADSKPFVCPICAKAFRRSKNLKSHMICHEGSKDYMCELCGKAFNRIDNMRAHVKTVHQGLQIRKKKQTAGSAAAAASASTVRGEMDGMIEEEMDGQITLEGPEGSSVIVEVRRQPPRQKRPPKVKLSAITTEISESDTASAAGALVALAIDPANPHDVVTMDQDELAAVAEQGEGDSNNSYETIQQRTTVFQLTPTGQAIQLPQNAGAQANIFYQYTYY